MWATKSVHQQLVDTFSGPHSAPDSGPRMGAMCSSKNGSRGGASLSELWVSRRSLGIHPCSVLWPGFGSSVLLRPSPGTGRPGTTKTRCLKHVLVFPTVGAAFRRIPRQSPRAVGRDVMGSKFCSPFLGRAGRGRRKPCVRKTAASVSHSWTPHLAEFLGSRLGWSAGTSWVQNFARPSWGPLAGDDKNQVCVCEDSWKLLLPGTTLRRISRQLPRAVGRDVMGSKFCSPFLGPAGRGWQKSGV